MKADIEWLVGVVRAGEQFVQYGDPFEFSCTVIRRGDEVEIIAASGAFSRKAYEAIRQEFVKAGITKATWDRRNTDKKRTVKKET